MSYAPTDVKRIGGSSQGSPVIEVLNTAKRVFAEFFEAQHGRRELARLATFDDAMLADIGIVRSDIEWALMQPWYADPSLALATRIGRRKEAVLWTRAFRTR